MTADREDWAAYVHSHSVMNRAWGLTVNNIAASNLVSRPLRSRIYRRCGLEVHTDQIFPGVRIHSCDIYIGPEVWINYGCYIENVARVVLEARSGLSPFTTIYTSTHEIGYGQHRWGQWSPQEVTIKSGTWVGGNCVILPGVTVGEGCMIAAGAVVHEDCEPNGLYGGVPARRLRDLEPLDERLGAQTAVPAKFTSEA